MVYYDGVGKFRNKPENRTNYITFYNSPKIVIESLRILTNWSNK